MGFFEDAAAFMKNKQPENDSTDELILENENDMDKLVTVCRELYENATRTEIINAIERTKDELDKPYSKKEFMKKLRVRLED